MTQTRSRGIQFMWALAIGCLIAASRGRADVVVRQDRDIYTLQNSRMRLEVDSAAGGRIRSWVIKPAERELIALWKGVGEIGGALDDRSFFTAMRYRAAITHPGPETGVLRLEATHASGLTVVKRLTLRRDSPALWVDHEWRNGTQAPQRLFIRNFLLPGSQPQTDEHLYWVRGAGEPVEASSAASGYYEPAEPAFAALWHRATGDGVLAHSPGVGKFYFWRGSKEFPTFEWLYEDTPPGSILRASTVLITVSGAAEAPDWEALLTAEKGPVRTASLVDLPGWVDEATKFGVTDEERERGFWVSIGAGDGKQRLPDPLPLDMPAGDSRYVSVTLNILKDFRAETRLAGGENAAADVKPYWEIVGEDRRELLPVPRDPIAFKAGSTETLWLRVSTYESLPTEDLVPVALLVGDAQMRFNIRVRAWDVQLPERRPFHVRGYCGGFPVWTGGYEVDEAKLRRLEAILRVFSEMGGNVLDWNGVWARMIPHTKIAETGESLAEVAKNEPERLDLDNLPALDFSYYDPWFELAKRYGVTRLETHMMHPHHEKLDWYLLGPAVGDGRAARGTPEAEKVIVWFFSEMKKYLAAEGFHGFFCKISDEISPEHIPTHIETARLARQAGWRPFTTITGMIARTARHINAMNPHCDQWQLSFGLKDDFLALRDRKFKAAEETHELTGLWGRYANGGAVDTWAMRVFGEGGVVPLEPDWIEDFLLLEDGRALQVKGGSPWGNKDRGFVITAGSLNDYLYVSPTAGAPEDHRYELKATVRREADDGRPLITLDPTDEVWCYGGGSSPFRAPYHRGYVYPIMTLHHNFDGYGLWAFYHWNKTERIVWIEEDTAEMTVSPVYCGYRDGWRDALLFNAVIAKLGRDAFSRIVGAGEEASLRIERASREVYSFTTLGNAGNPLARNAAREKALRLLSAREE